MGYNYNWKWYRENGWFYLVTPFGSYSIRVEDDISLRDFRLLIEIQKDQAIEDLEMIMSDPHNQQFKK